MIHPDPILPEPSKDAQSFLERKKIIDELFERYVKPLEAENERLLVLVKNLQEEIRDERVKGYANINYDLLDQMMLDKCPICNGTGKFEFPKAIEADSTEIKQRIAKELRAKGYSIRQIMRGLNYKSPRSITELLKKP